LKLPDVLQQVFFHLQLVLIKKVNQKEEQMKKNDKRQMINFKLQMSNDTKKNPKFVCLR
jgi:hypothetical protein